VQVSKEGKTAAADSVGQERLPRRERISSLVTNSDQWTFRIRLRHQMSNASIFGGNMLILLSILLTNQSTRKLVSTHKYNTVTRQNKIWRLAAILTRKPS